MKNKKQIVIVTVLDITLLALFVFLKLPSAALHVQVLSAGALLLFILAEFYPWIVARQRKLQLPVICFFALLQISLMIYIYGVARDTPAGDIAKMKFAEMVLVGLIFVNGIIRPLAVAQSLLKKIPDASANPTSPTPASSLQHSGDTPPL